MDTLFNDKEINCKNRGRRSCWLFNVEPLEKRSNQLKFSDNCKPEEGWYDQPKYCYENAIHVVMISFAVVFGLTPFSVFSSSGHS